MSVNPIMIGLGYYIKKGVYILHIREGGKKVNHCISKNAALFVGVLQNIFWFNVCQPYHDWFRILH